MPAKVTLDIPRIAVYKYKREEMAGNAGIYTNDPSLLANKDKDNAYNRAYKPPTNIEEKGSSKDNSKGKEEEDNSNNNSTSNSASNSKDKAGYGPSNSSLYYKGKF
ncbi:hypothetical protein P8C59_003211 [Phyllachora maydis]|uniref:Uncharacterized protein n=1 Tax=Phyllachora maydis TaxID=1825666 RepID=A0AAD9M8Z2_9PEZI|nr:hypothetical protein P8C59_003211 [Phyllachora maydis]